MYLTYGKNNECRFSPALSDLSVCTPEPRRQREEEEEAGGAGLHRVDNDFSCFQEKLRARPTVEG